MNEEFVLDPFQKQAIDYAHSNNSVIVSAPTGAGKTLIAERVIEDCMSRNKGVIYTAPIKALSNQKFRDFSKKYPDQTGILTGDVTINRNAPILIMTTEIFRNAIMVSPEEFTHREWIIFDEIHYLDDIERGTVWEEAIILLPKHMRMLALSATIPNIDDFVTWLQKVHAFPIKKVIEETRPVPLHFFFQCNNDFFSSINSLKESALVELSIQKIPYKERDFAVKNNRLHALTSYLKKNNGYPCLYFCFSRRRCEELAREAAGVDFLDGQEKEKMIRAFRRITEKFNISSSHINFLYPLIKQGIAYHHAGLLPTIKEVVEQLFTTGLIKLIFTTETFALGINMPARTVVFDSLSKFYGHYHGYLKTRDFYQMAGRAGRRGIDREGSVLSRINPNHIDFDSLTNIIHGSYEPICSQLNSCYATIMNLYRGMGEKIYDIYPNSFHCHQAKAWQQKEVLGLLKRKLALLKELGYIRAGEITRKAEIASKVYSFELNIGELFELGFLDNLNEESLFIVITALVYEPRKGERRPRLNKRIKRINRELMHFSHHIHRQEKKFHIAPVSKRFFFHLNEACKAWFEGKEFTEIAKLCTVDEGEIVRYFRMSIQVLRELYTCPALDAAFKNKIRNCLYAVNRDVIDAEKQLRQEI